MRTISLALSLVVTLAATAPALAGTLRAKVAFNTAVQKPAANQPADGYAVTWDVKLSGGELDGCTASFAESLFPRDNMSWGIFQLEGNVACDKGAFKFTSTGSWGKNGFHGAGVISQDGRSGEFSTIFHASIMHIMVSGQANALIIMIAEKAAELIRSRA